MRKTKVIGGTDHVCDLLLTAVDVEEPTRPRVERRKGLISYGRGLRCLQHADHEEDKNG